MVTSVTSDCKLSAFILTSRLPLQQTHQVEDASGGSLVLSTLGKEKQALAGLSGPGGSGRSGGSGGQVLGLDGLLAEVEVALGEAQAPGNGVPVSLVLSPLQHSWDRLTSRDRAPCNQALHR